MNEAENEPINGVIIPVGKHYRVNSNRHAWILQDRHEQALGHFRALDSLKKVALRDHGNVLSEGGFVEVDNINRQLQQTTGVLVRLINEFTGLEGLVKIDRRPLKLYQWMAGQQWPDDVIMGLDDKPVLRVDKHQFIIGRWVECQRKKGGAAREIQGMHYHKTIESALVAELFYHFRSLSDDNPIRALRKAARPIFDTVNRFQSCCSTDVRSGYQVALKLAIKAKQEDERKNAARKKKQPETSDTKAP